MWMRTQLSAAGRADRSTLAGRRSPPPARCAALCSRITILLYRAFQEVNRTSASMPSDVIFETRCEVPVLKSGYIIDYSDKCARSYNNFNFAKKPQTSYPGSRNNISFGCPLLSAIHTTEQMRIRSACYFQRVLMFGASCEYILDSN